MRRVCIVRLTRYPWQRNVRRNAETLASHGYEVDVICGRGKGEKKREVMNGVNVYRLPLEHHRGSVARRVFEYSVFFVQASLELARLSLKKRYDVVEVHTMPDFLIFVTLFPRLLGSKVILYMFENMPALFVSTYKKSPNHFGTRLLQFLEKASARYAHHVITSEGIPYKRILEDRGIPSDKITVVLNVPDNAIFDDQRITASQDDGAFRIAIVSTIVPRYGVQTVIKSVSLLQQQIPELVVDVIGDGEYRPELERLARRLGVHSRINFMGHIYYDDVPQCLSRAHLAIAPMLDDVGVPNKLFEYFALRKPAIASALPSLLETFDGNCVQYFQPGDEKDLAAQVLELYRNPERRASLAASGHEVYKGFQWQSMKQEYLKVHEALGS